MIKTKYTYKKFNKYYSEIGTGYYLWNNKKIFIKCYELKDNYSVNDVLDIDCFNCCKFRNLCINDIKFFVSCNRSEDTYVTIDGEIKKCTRLNPILISKIENL